MKRVMGIILVLIIVACVFAFICSNDDPASLATPPSTEMTESSASAAAPEEDTSVSATAPEESTTVTDETESTGATDPEESAAPSETEDPPPSTQPATTKPTTPTQTKPGNTQGGNSGPKVIAQGNWDSGPVVWKITEDGTLSFEVEGRYHIQGKMDYIWQRQYGEFITKVVIGDGITSIPNNAFNFMPNLKEVYIGNAVTIIRDHAFTRCPSLESVVFPESLKTLEKNAFEDCTSLTSVVFKGKTSIGKQAFVGCVNITSVTMENVEAIGTSAFAGCSSLKAITIPSNVTVIPERAFSGCSSLETISFAEGTALQTIGMYAFRGAAIRELTLPESLTVIDYQAFAECKQLQSLHLRGNNPRIGKYVFQNCTSLEKVIIENCGLYANVFEGCSAITSIEFYNPRLCKIADLPSLSSVVVSGTASSTGSFQNCSALTSVAIQAPITNVSERAFYNCPALTSITLPETVQKIYNYAFVGSGITKITIPASVTILGDTVFSSQTTEITFLGNAPEQIDSAAFKSVTATVYYPAGNETWTEEVRKDYGGTLTWVAQ